MKKVMILVMSLLLLCSGCQKKDPNCSKQVLNINIPSDPATLDPRKGGDLVSSMLHFLLFDGLTRLNNDGSITNSLAEKIEISDDKKEYTFHLRRAKWSDGSPIHARDIEKSWKDILAPTFPAANAHLLYPIHNAQNYKMGTVAREAVGIKTLDDYTLKVNLTSPIPYFLELISFCVFYPVNADLDIKKPNWENEVGSQFICSGPFTIASWKHNDEIVLKKNPNYWKSQDIKLEMVNICMIRDEMTALQMFQKGDLDILGNPLSPLPTDAVPQLKKEGKLQLKPVGATTFCTFNVKEPPFTNAKIRKAFAYAIDRAQITQNVTQLSEIPALTVIPPVLKKGENTPFFSDADIDKARALFKEGLQELGLTRETFPKLSYDYSRSDLHHKVAQALQQQWRRVLGVQIVLEDSDHKILMQKLKAGSYSIAQMYWVAQYHDAMNIFERFKYAENVKNYPNWENEEYISLLEQSFFAPTEKDRADILQRAESIFLDEMPLAPIFHWNSAFIIQNYIKNYDLMTIGDGLWENVYIDTEAKQVWR